MKHINYISDFEQWKKEFTFYVPIEIRFSETDMFGHMNNVSPFIYFEEARIKYLKSLNIYHDLKNPEYFPIVADLQCDFHKQIYFGQQLNLYVKTNSVRNSSFDIHYMALNEEEDICLTGRGQLVNIDAKTGKPAVLDNSVKERLLQQK